MPAPNELKKYLAGVAAPASLLAHRARGCNEIYHLKYFFVPPFYQLSAFL